MARIVGPEAIEKGTGKSWEEWVAILSAVDPERRGHQELVAAAVAAGAKSWWCQMVVVAYEQHLGLRLPGQDVTGEFAISASSTRAASLDDALDQWLRLVEGRAAFSDVAIVRGPEQSSSAKWRYWRCGLEDGSRIVVNIGEKPPDRSVITVQHEKLATKELAESWRNYWRTLLREAR